MKTPQLSRSRALQLTLRHSASLLVAVAVASVTTAQTSQFQSAGGTPSRQTPTPRLWAWPLPGVDGTDWVINNYVDIDPGPGVRDYNGGGKSYNGHRGIDIDVPSFQAMDADFPVRSVERGMVVALDDVHFDRNTSCVGQWNFVTVQHDDGLRTTYGHLKQNSVVVTMGQVVDRGETLAVVGSSGCSTYPHLHLETRDELDAVVDPFTEGFWQHPPVYNTPLSLMQAIITEGSVGGVAEIADPGANATQLAFGDVLGVGLSMAGGGIGSQTRVQVRRPDGTLHGEHTFVFNQVYRHSFWIWNFPLSEIIGTWTVDIQTNGQAAASFPVLVGPPATAPRVTRLRIPAADYQGEFEFYLGLGYRPVWFDGFDSNGSTYFNVIFEQGTPAAWVALHGLSSGGLDSWLSQLVGTGWRPTHLESYLLNGSIRYALLAENTPGPEWVAYHSASNGTHGTNFNTLASQGYHTTVTSPLVVGGAYYVTALFEKSSVGAWTSYYGMDSAGYQSRFNSEAAAGRYLSYINVYDDGGTPRFSAMWNSVQPNAWVANHDVSLSTMNSQDQVWQGQGLGMRFVTGYASGSQELYGACWKN